MFETRPDRGAEVVLVGRSNVGKSTLMREITGHDVDTGRRPGVTQSPNFYDWASEDFLLSDLPGFGFMEGVEADRREEIKTGIVRYVEDHADAILAAVLVLDGNAVVEIIDRHEDRGEVPHDVDMYGFLREVGIPVVLAVNKMDKVGDRDDRLDEVADRFGLLPPWQQWPETIAPITAKGGRIGPLNDAVREHLREAKREDLLGFF